MKCKKAVRFADNVISSIEKCQNSTKQKALELIKYSMMWPNTHAKATPAALYTPVSNAGEKSGKQSYSHYPPKIFI